MQLVRKVAYVCKYCYLVCSLAQRVVVDAAAYNMTVNVIHSVKGHYLLQLQHSFQSHLYASISRPIFYFILFYIEGKVDELNEVKMEHVRIRQTEQKLSKQSLRY